MNLLQVFLPAVMEIVLSGPNCSGRGTGFFVSPDGLVVTNKHVIGCTIQNPATPVTFKVGSGETYSRYSVLVCGKTLGKDICVLRLPAYPSKHFRVGSDFPLVGTPVYHMGNAGGRGLQIKEGRFIGRMNHSGTSEVQLSMLLEKGDSGGPVFTASGQLVGVAYQYLTHQASGLAGKHLKGKVLRREDYAISAWEVDRLLSRHFDAGGGELTPAAFLRKMGASIQWFPVRKR